MDGKKFDFIKEVIIDLQEFLAGFKKDEVPENCIEDLTKVLTYVENECPNKLEPNHLPQTSIDILKKKYGRNKPTE